MRRPFCVLKTEAGRGGCRRLRPAFCCLFAEGLCRAALRAGYFLHCRAAGFRLAMRLRLAHCRAPASATPLGASLGGFACSLAATGTVFCALQRNRPGLALGALVCTRPCSYGHCTPRLNKHFPRHCPQGHPWAGFRPRTTTRFWYTPKASKNVSKGTPL